MRWLIVEDALRDRKGHWFEWVSTFYEGLRELGDEVTVLADSSVLPEIRDPLAAEAILPNSIWHRMGDGAGALHRYSRYLTHGLKTARTMRNYLRSHTEADIIFVPTVITHHLVGWAPLIKSTLRTTKTRILLFFLTGPFVVDPPSGKVSLESSPSCSLLRRLLKWIEPEIRIGKVILGVETENMRREMEQVLRLPFVHFPQPVKPVQHSNPGVGAHPGIEMACFGAARAEKGSDVLQHAIQLYRQRFPASRATFTQQWIEDFRGEDGRLHTKNLSLAADEKVKYIDRYFADGEYDEHLSRTQVLLLPYRVSSYVLRGSRVVIDAVVNGIPVVVTRGTILQQVAAKFGAGVSCEDGNVESLVAAIREMELLFDEISASAKQKRAIAGRYFSVRTFRETLLSLKPLDSASNQVPETSDLKILSASLSTPRRRAPEEAPIEN
jgi:glycosyltransferase involved in cell wall biosynthesis